MNQRTASDIGMPEKVAPEVSALVKKIMALLPAGKQPRKPLKILLSNFSVEALTIICDTASEYDTDTLSLLSKTLGHEAKVPMIHTVAKRETRAVFVTAIVPVTMSFVLPMSEEEIQERMNRGWSRGTPIALLREFRSTNYQTQLMDSPIKTGREIHRLQGSDWVTYARGMAVMQELEKYRIDSKSHDFEFAMMLGTRFEEVRAISEKLIALKGSVDDDSGYSKETVRYLLDGGAPALLDGFLG